ncbi:MAG TPA: HigA family addiction module antitoxin [Treponemataceae bacterium]|nr:HigA family addiction module antitoxin [Treponemataceae bacterium]
MNGRKPTHPGEVLYEDVIKELDISITEAAKHLGVSRKTLSELVNGKSSLTPEMAVRIAKSTNTTPESWINMQIKLDLWKVMQNETINTTPFKNRVA